MTSEDGHDRGRKLRARAAPALAGVVLFAILAPSVLYPGARTIIEVAGSIAQSDSWSEGWAGPSPRSIGLAVSRSLSAALVIALLATALAWPAARLLARGRRAAVWAPLLLTPMLMPSYLAYSGWGLARAPGTLLGDALVRFASSGARWAPVLTGQTLAIIALALWASPLAALVLASSMARQDSALDDALRLEPASLAQRLHTTLAIHRTGIASSVALVVLATLGSSVPLHLAQLDTLGIVVWRELSESSRADWWRAWVSAAPLLALALLGAWIIGARLVRAARSDQDEPPRDDSPRASSLVTRSGALGVWLIAVGGPILLFAITIKHSASLWTFWRLNGEGVMASLVVSLMVALATGAIALSISYLLSTRSAWGAMASLLSVRVLLLSALTPGVLVGAALIESHPSVDPHALPVLSGVARFGFLGAVAACVGAWGEPAARRDARLLHSSSLRAWTIACLPGQWALLVGAALGAGLMSIHEIESSVIVQPPGRGAMAQQILSYLHFARLEEMSVAGLWLVGGGGVIAAAATGLMGLGVRRLGRGRNA